MATANVGVKGREHIPKQGGEQRGKEIFLPAWGTFKKSPLLLLQCSLPTLWGEAGSQGAATPIEWVVASISPFLKFCICPRLSPCILMQGTECYHRGFVMRQVMRDVTNIVLSVTFLLYFLLGTGCEQSGLAASHPKYGCSPGHLTEGPRGSAGV